MADAAQTFLRADDETLIKVIGCARQRLVFIAPGVWKKTALALATALEQETDQLVSALYGLTPAEIKLVEDSLQK